MTTNPVPLSFSKLTNQLKSRMKDDLLFPWITDDLKYKKEHSLAETLDEQCFLALCFQKPKWVRESILEDWVLKANKAHENLFVTVDVLNCSSDYLLSF